MKSRTAADLAKLEEGIDELKYDAGDEFTEELEDALDRITQDIEDLEEEVRQLRTHDLTHDENTWSIFMGSDGFE